MCLSCGCHEPYESHGNPDHITMDDVKAAASAAGITPEDVAENITADLERSSPLGTTTEGVDPAAGTDLDALLATGEAKPNS